MRRTLIIYVFMLLLSSLTIASAQNPEECKRELLKALNKESNEEKLDELNKRIRKCPNHDLTLIATAKLYAEMGKEADPDWLRIAIKHYQTAVDVPSTYTGTARWGLASLLEYAGEYELAIPHYQWIAEQGRSRGINEKRISEARAHLITCRFVMKNAKRPANTSVAQTNGSVDAERLDLSDASIKERAGWSFLKEFVASVAIAGGMAALKTEGNQIQVALGLLYDWSQAPQKEKVEARNRFLAGMISTIATTIAEKKLGLKLANMSLPNGQSGKVEDIPEGGYAGSAEEEFSTQKPQEGRNFEVSDDFTIVEKWDVPNLSGEWTAHQYSCRSSPPTFIPESYCEASIQQSGTQVTLVAKSRYQGKITNTSTYTGQIQGSSVNLILVSITPSYPNEYSFSGNIILTIDGNGSKLYGQAESTPQQHGVTARTTCQVEMTRR